MRSRGESATLGENLHHAVDRLRAVQRRRLGAADDLHVIDHRGIDLVHVLGVRDFHAIYVRLERRHVEQLARAADVDLRAYARAGRAPVGGENPRDVATK